jgi:hypothetical protein
MPPETYRGASKKGPNGVSNAFLREVKGKEIVVILIGDDEPNFGRLVAWDSYSMVIERNGKDHLLQKQPGMMVWQRGDD